MPYKVNYWNTNQALQRYNCNGRHEYWEKAWGTISLNTKYRRKYSSSSLYDNYNGEIDEKRTKGSDESD